MDLKSLFAKKDLPEELLAVKISTTQVCAASWKIVEGKVALSKVTQTNVNDGNYLAAADEVISPISQTTSKVIFGLPFHWVTDGQVVPEKLTLLRNLCNELDLKPEGFILLSEALENYCKEVEGAPLTAILAEFDGPDGLLTMYRAGKNLGSVPINADRENINEELETSLKKLSSAEVFPSRIIVCDGQTDLEKLAEKITSHPWTKNLPFLHFPKVEIFDSPKMVQAVAVAGGMQMGGHFDNEPVTQEPQHFPEMSPQAAGFFSEEPGQDVVIQNEPVFEDNVTPLPQTKLTEKITSFLSTVKLPKLKLPKPNFKFQGKNPILIFGSILLAILILFGLTLYFVPQVTVILKVSPPTFDHVATVFVSTDGSSGTGLVVNGSLVTVSEIGSQKSVATGHKLVGDKAKGTVTIYSVAGAKTFPAGTALTSLSGLKFSLDQSVDIASGDAITRSTANASVTAADIGYQYNLASGTKFSLGGTVLSDYAAQTDTGTTGGTSHQATVVTKEDQDRLLATLSAQLSDQAKTDLQTKLGSGQNLLPNAVISNVSKKKFSKDIGMEADTVSLDMTVDYSGVVFAKGDVVTAYTNNSPSDIPSGFALSGDRLNLDITDIKTDKSGNSSLKVHLSSGLVPVIDQPKLIAEIAGKSLAITTANLSKVSGATGVEVTTQPRFLAFVTNMFLPWKKDNIKLEIVTQ